MFSDVYLKNARLHDAIAELETMQRLDGSRTIRWVNLASLTHARAIPTKRKKYSIECWNSSGREVIIVPGSACCSMGWAMTSMLWSRWRRLSRNRLLVRLSHSKK